MLQDVEKKIVECMIAVAQLSGVGSEAWHNHLLAYGMLFDDKAEWTRICNESIKPELIKLGLMK